MVWVVYKASFTTQRGTRRLYFGCTRNPEGREAELQNSGKRQPAWLKAGCRGFSFTILVPDCASKQAALATITISDFNLFHKLIAPTTHNVFHERVMAKQTPLVFTSKIC